MAVHKKTLTNRAVAALKVERDTVYWDRDLPGFGIRVYPGGGKVYIAQAREPDKTIRRVTVGRHDVLNADQARQRAAFIIARIKAGEDPVPLPLAARYNGGPTVADLAERYLEEHAAVRIKPSTQRRVRSMLHNHILPALGRMPLEAVERSDIVEFHQKLSGRPVTANKSVKVLSHMYRLGEGWGLVPEDFNPCRSVEKYPERSRERFLTDAEFTRLGRVLDEAVESGAAPLTAVTAIRLLMLTGCRKNEILDPVAGRTSISAPASSISPIPKPVPARCSCRRRRSNYWKCCRDGRTAPGCFRATTGRGATAAAVSTMPGVPCATAARLEDVRLHDLRHSFASRALALGETLPVIGKLLGHSDIETTARYAHLAHDSIHEAAERIAGSIAADIL